MTSVRRREFSFVEHPLFWGVLFINVFYFAATRNWSGPKIYEETFFPHFLFGRPFGRRMAKNVNPSLRAICTKLHSVIVEVKYSDLAASKFKNNFVFFFFIRRKSESIQEFGGWWKGKEKLWGSVRFQSGWCKNARISGNWLADERTQVE